jgi:1-deoxy-D-xylulose-5-phosphate reductoisomerase
MQAPAPRLRLAEVGQLTFEAPDERKFPALRLAREALRRRGAAPIVLNAANEVAVESFLSEEIGFLDIPRVVERAMEAAPTGHLNALTDVIEVDQEARARARCIIQAFR